MKDSFHPPKIVDCLVHLVIVKISRHGEKKYISNDLFMFFRLSDTSATWHHMTPAARRPHLYAELFPAFFVSD